ncbi:MAG: RNA methyltransferase [Sumerlaeia bacterium]
MTEDVIQSAKNPRIKQWKALHSAKGRREAGLFLAEGPHLVEEALASRWPIETLLLAEGSSPPPVVGRIESVWLSEPAMRAVSETEAPQGMAAVCRLPESGASLPAGERFLLLDAVQDPGNVGTLIRVADAMGLDGVILGPGSADPFSGKVLRSAQGSVFHLPVRRGESLEEALREMKARGLPVLAADMMGTPIREFRGGASFALVMGNEGAGLSEQALAFADHRVSIPMRGRAESLNVGVAAGICLYELLRG